MTGEPKYHRSGADMSPCGAYRYRLWRRWDHGYMCVWVMLNPSTADADTDDATIRRCIGFAKMWGYAGIEVVNLYPLRSTDPKAMLRNPERSGPKSTFASALRAAVVRQNKNVVCAWGAHAEPMVADAFLTQAEREVGWQNVTCLGVTKGNGQPRHPVRLAYATPRFPVAIAQGRRTPELEPPTKD